MNAIAQYTFLTLTERKKIENRVSVFSNSQFAHLSVSPIKYPKAVSNKVFEQFLHFFP